VLSHAADEDGVRDFAGQIATTVRDLGLHHPRSSCGRFVTVTARVLASRPADSKLGAKQCIENLLADEPEAARTMAKAG
jgi:hypothetical protein